MSTPAEYQENKQYWVDQHLRKTYGLSPGAYEALLEKQGGKCALCGLPPKPGKRLVVDHDHRCCSGKKKTCGKCLRGLLHAGCNVRLGAVEDLEFLLAAQAYLQRF